MPQWIIKTPNGKYAAFSSRVDHFVAYGASREEIVKFCIDDWDNGPKMAESKVRLAEEDHGRYEEAIEKVELFHGSEEAVKYRSLLESYESGGPVTGNG